MAKLLICWSLLVSAAAIAGVQWCEGRLGLLIPPPFADREVQLWLTNWRHVPLPEPSVLSQAEQMRLSNILVRAAADELVHTRTFLRGMLSRYLNLPPAEIPIARAGNGKPSLGIANAPLRFNLSHTGELALLGVLSSKHWGDAQIGVDIERIDPKLDWKKLAPYALSAVELKYLESLPPEKAAEEYYRIWTLKEAILKAIGQNSIMNPVMVSAVDELGRVKIGGYWDKKHYQAEVTRDGDHWIAIALAADHPIPAPKIKITRLIAH